MIYFTSDTHFWHKHIIDYCARPWADLDEMNAGLIGLWNQRIKDEDEVYHLGDFSFCGKVEGQKIFDQLKGRKHLVRGNHDPNGTKNLGWESVNSYLEIRPQIEYQQDTGELMRTPQLICLFHFPILSWNGMAHGSWHLHGHCHGSLPDNGSLRLDVGVDALKYDPISLEEVQRKMALRTVVPVDHHR